MNTQKTEQKQKTSIRRLLCLEVPLDRAFLQPGELEIVVGTEKDLNEVLQDFHALSADNDTRIYLATPELLQATCLDIHYKATERRSHSGFEEDKVLAPHEEGLGPLYLGMLRKDPDSYWVLAAEAQRHGGI